MDTTLEYIASIDTIVITSVITFQKPDGGRTKESVKIYIYYE